MVMAIVFVFGLFLANYAIMAADAPEKVDLSPYKVSKKGVCYDHKVHLDNKIECKTCHHKAKDGKDQVKCSECHKKEAEGTTPNDKTAFHKLCQDCHKKTVEAKADSKAPTKCNDCHKL